MTYAQIDEDAPEDPVERLFYVARQRGPDRNALIDPNAGFIKIAAWLSKHKPTKYAELLSILAGWVSVSVFKQRVQKFVAKAEENYRKRQVEKETEERINAAADEGRPLIAQGKPSVIARDFIKARRPHLIFLDNQFLDYVGSHYEKFEDREIRKQVTEYMESGVNAESGEPFYPTKRDIDEAVDAIATVAHRSLREAEPPTWLDPWPLIDSDPKATIACRNGLVELSGGRRLLRDHDPRFFTLNGLSYDYDPDAPEPTQWLHFLDEVWPDEDGQENRDALQEIIGHLLTGETKYQKIFMFVGSKRAGKGTIARVLEGLIGSRNIASQSVTKLGKEFGLKALLGKQVMVVPDLRLGKDSNTGGIVETLLNISGEDAISVGRKFEDDKGVRLNTRILLLSNMELVLPDQSGALLSRLVPLRFEQNFEHRADTTLTARLLTELPGILNWALDGLERLEGRRDPMTGRQLGFKQTTTGQKMLDDIERHGSSVHAFLRECCDVVKGASVSKAILYKGFEHWCDDHDITLVPSPEKFTSHLKTASGQVIEPWKPGPKGAQVPSYRNVCFKADCAPEPDTEDD